MSHLGCLAQIANFPAAAFNRSRSCQTGQLVYTEGHLAAESPLHLGLYIMKVTACVHKVHPPCVLATSNLIMIVLSNFMVLLQHRTTTTKMVAR